VSLVIVGSLGGLIAAVSYYVGTISVGTQSSATVTLVRTMAFNATTANISNLQSIALAYVGQESIAHAALIFATLTAAFTFAAGYKGVERYEGVLLYVLILTVLLSSGFYSFLRVTYWATLSNQILTTGPSIFSSSTCASVIYLRDYWACVTSSNTPSQVIVLYLGTTTASIPLSWVIGFLSAVAIASYLPKKKAGRLKNFGDIFAGLHFLFRVAFWAAIIDYGLEVTIVGYLSTRQFDSGWPVAEIGAMLSLAIGALYAKYWKSANRFGWSSFMFPLVLFVATVALRTALWALNLK
jgi:hypothetical protein